MDIVVLLVLLIALIAVLTPQSGANQSPITVYIGPQPPDNRANVVLLLWLMLAFVMLSMILLSIFGG